MGRPAQQGGASLVFKYLLGGPQAVGRIFGLDPYRAMPVELPVEPAVKIRDVGWVDQGYAALVVEEPKRWAQQLHFADAGPHRYEFD